MVIVVRQDLKLSAGKMAAQVAHAAVNCAFAAKRRTPDWFDRGTQRAAGRRPPLQELYAVKVGAEDLGPFTSLITDAVTRYQTYWASARRRPWWTGPGHLRSEDEAAGVRTGNRRFAVHLREQKGAAGQVVAACRCALRHHAHRLRCRRQRRQYAIADIAPLRYRKTAQGHHDRRVAVGGSTWWTSTGCAEDILAPPGACLITTTWALRAISQTGSKGWVIRRHRCAVSGQVPLPPAV